MPQRSSIYIERVIQAVEDLRAFDARDAERLAEELRELPPDRAAEHIAHRLKGYVDRESVIVALWDTL